MTLLWQDPPERANLVFNRRVVAELRSEPGRWALIRVYAGHSSRDVEQRKHPVDIELRAAYRTVEGRRCTELYARARRP